MTLRWGLVTAGKICNDFTNAFNSYKGEKGDQAIVAVAARDKTRAEQFAKLHGISKVFDSYKAMAVSKDIDIAYVGSLHVDHYELSRLYLENGKHVLCEKSLCLNFKQAQSLVNLARSKKLFFMEAVWSRFSPSYAALEKEINSGALGDIKYVNATFGVVADKIDRIAKKELGGSALMDLGVYVLQFAQYVFKDEPEKMTVVGGLNENGVDMYETILLEYSGGRRAVLTVDATNRLWNHATVCGTKGRIRMEDPFHFAVEMVKSDGQVQKFPLHSSNLPYNFDNSAGLVYEAIEAARCIKAGLLESPKMSHNESLVLAKLEDAARKQLGVHYDADDMEYP